MASKEIGWACVRAEIFSGLVSKQMHSQIELRGQSGAVYRYMDLFERRPLMPGTAGNYVFLREDEGGAALLYVGETTDLLTGIDEGWSEAVARHGATHRLTRLNISRQTRREERADLVLAHNPPMNCPSDSVGLLVQ